VKTNLIVNFFFFFYGPCLSTEIRERLGGGGILLNCELIYSLSTFYIVFSVIYFYLNLEIKAAL